MTTQSVNGEAIEPPRLLEGGKVLDRIAALGEGAIFRKSLRTRANFLATGGDEFRFGVVPGSGANSIDGAHSRFSGARRRAEVRTPCVIAGAFGCGQRLTMRVGFREVRQISVVAQPLAGHEERH